MFAFLLIFSPAHLISTCSDKVVELDKDTLHEVLQKANICISVGIINGSGRWALAKPSTSCLSTEHRNKRLRTHHKQTRPADTESAVVFHFHTSTLSRWWKCVFMWWTEKENARKADALRSVAVCVCVRRSSSDASTTLRSPVEERPVCPSSSLVLSQVGDDGVTGLRRWHWCHPGMRKDLLLLLLVHLRCAAHYARCSHPHGSVGAGSNRCDTASQCPAIRSASRTKQFHSSVCSTCKHLLPTWAVVTWHTAQWRFLLCSSLLLHWIAFVLISANRLYEKVWTPLWGCVIIHFIFTGNDQRGMPFII